ncbi:MAG: hypothetical protein AB2692_23565 [Candidatus Thiodiazotropha sp.]
MSIVIPSGLVEDEAKNKNARIEISNIPVVDGQPPKVVLEELYEPLETASKYTLPFDKDLFFIENEDAARSNIVLHNNNKVYGTTPERVRLEEGSKLVLEGVDFLGAERFSVEIGANIVMDGLGNQNVAINLPEIQVRADREPPVLSEEQDSIAHLSEEYEIQFNERVVLVAEISAGGGGCPRRHSHRRGHNDTPGTGLCSSG